MITQLIFTRKELSMMLNLNCNTDANLAYILTKT